MSEKVVLLVDDEDDILVLLDRMLTDRGYNVVTCNRGRHALELAKSKKPNIIFVDIVLPDLGGPEVVKTLKEDPQTRPIPIVFMSGIVSKEDQDPSQGVHVDGVRYPALAKPFSIQEMIDEIDKAFSSSV